MAGGHDDLVLPDALYLAELPTIVLSTNRVRYILFLRPVAQTNPR
jgi:hypothetical protein